MEGDLYHQKMSVQQVDQPHGCSHRHEVWLDMVNEEFNCDLQSVVCVRAVLHFVHLWQREAKLRKLLRQQAAYLVLLLLLAKHLPPSIGYEIYACFRLQKQVQAQQSTLTASGIQRQSSTSEHLLA